jgi:lysine 2,3-aminomutase
MAQFTHSRELALEAREAIAAIRNSGVVIMNQTPLIRGINDNPEAIAVLLNEISYMGGISKLSIPVPSIEGKSDIYNTS